MARRLEDQFDRYRSKAKELNSQLYVLQWGIYIFGGIGTLLAAVKLGAWVAVTISLTSVFSSFLEFKRIEETLISYNQAADSLYDIRVLWDSLSDQEKNKSENFELLVKTTEETIQRENESWLQNMQDSLVEFYKKIDKTPGNKPETEN
ncbi:SLATT domain-containing protein [Kovacikia minuta CCNUW1]|nr:SLATT domain-containing protein [Kovacikia minuta CCNUW1]